jgi:hypothetical protein
MPTIIPAGETRPVRIPRLSQIYINEVPVGTLGKLELQYINPPEIINYPLVSNPHPVIYNIPGEICNIRNVCKTSGSHVVIT